MFCQCEKEEDIQPWGGKLSAFLVRSVAKLRYRHFSGALRPWAQGKAHAEVFRPGLAAHRIRRKQTLYLRSPIVLGQ
jgi:hypothetical protein